MRTDFSARATARRPRAWMASSAWIQWRWWSMKCLARVASESNLRQGRMALMMGGMELWSGGVVEWVGSYQLSVISLQVAGTHERLKFKTASLGPKLMMFSIFVIGAGRISCS